MFLSVTELKKDITISSGVENAIDVIRIKEALFHNKKRV